MCRYSIVIFVVGLWHSGYSQFVKNHDVSEVLPDLAGGSVAWGDYDADGDQDLVLTGAAGNAYTYIFRNENGQFTNINAAVTAVVDGSVDWGDFDNDGDLDILVSGITTEGEGLERITYSITKIFRNDDGTFIEHHADLEGINEGTIRWGDYNNDNQLDIALIGSLDDVAENDVLKVYLNDGGVFTSIPLPVQPNGSGLKGSVSWGDYDGDLDLDLLITGLGTNLAGDDLVTMILRNDDGNFVDSGFELPGIASGFGEWSDYNNDGDLDLALSGVLADGTFKSIIYKNVSGIFTDIGAPLENIGHSYLTWSDFDNDNDEDLIISGISGITFNATFRVFANNAGVFTAYEAPIPFVWAEHDWADINGDNFPDLVLTGLDEANDMVTAVFENIPGPNQKILYKEVLGKTYGDPSFDLTASASSGLPVEFFLLDGPATLVDKTITVTGAGEIAIEILQAGNEDFFPESELMLIVVNKKILTVTADDKSITYGDVLPEFTFTYEGFVADEGKEMITEEPVVTSSATHDSNADTYEITLRGGEDENYDFTLINGVLTIGKALAIVTLSDLEQFFDGIQKTIKVTTHPEELNYIALYNGDVNAPSAVGTYMVSVTLNEQNYEGEAHGNLIIQLISSRDKDTEHPEIYIHPVPAINYLNLSGDVKNLMRITLHNISGKIVLDEFVSGQYQFDVSHLSAGTYIISLFDLHGVIKTQTLLIK